MLWLLLELHGCWTLRRTQSKEDLRTLSFLGSCGVLDQSIQADKIILPSSALRDEGTSYHYAPASDEIAYDQSLLLTMEKALDKSWH